MNHTCNFKFSGTTVRKLKEIGEIDFNTFFLTQYIQIVIMATCNQQERLRIFYNFLIPSL